MLIPHNLNRTSGIFFLSFKTLYRAVETFSHLIWNHYVHTSHSTPFSVTLTGFLHTPQLSFASDTIATVEVVTSSLETLLPDPVF